MSEPSFVVETLAWCNERRKERGMEPLERLPKGKKMEGSSCPCGKATGLHVSLYDYYEQGSRERVRLGANPRPVREFIRAFDAGRLQQYEENGIYCQ